MDPIDCLDLDDVLAVPWKEVVPAPPPAESVCYFLDSTFACARFLTANGPAFVARCRLYHYLADGDRVLAVEPVGDVVEMSAHAVKLLTEIFAESQV